MKPQENQQLAVRKAISAHEECEATLIDLINVAADAQYERMLERVQQNLSALRAEA